MIMKKNWNFDEVIDRAGTDAVKWEPDVLSNVFGKPGRDLLPMWVADMDFRCPEPMTNALLERAGHPVYGYTRIAPAYFDALIRWYEKRHQWVISKSWILTTPGVVPAVNYVIQRFSKPGDKILIQPPVYYPFARSIKNNGRQILNNPLKITGSHYEMDFNDLEKKLKDPRVKIAILCSPHNPVGRVWTRHELEVSGIRVFELQGTYLAWVDFTNIESNEERRIRIMEHKAKIALDHGLWFGADGAGFERFNLACPRSILEKAIKAIIAAFKKDAA
jgi:cystathionine beta-lyase